MRDGPRRRLVRGGSHARGTLAGQDDARGADHFGRAHDRAQVARIRDVVEHHDERRAVMFGSVVFGSLHDVLDFRIRVRNGLRDHALVVLDLGHFVHDLARRQLHRHVRVARLAADVLG